MIRKLSALLALLMLLTSGVSAQRPKFKQLPPPGIEIKPDELKTLQSRLSELSEQLGLLESEDEQSIQWQPDVEVLLRAVRLAIENGTFYKKSDPRTAGRLLDEAARRLDAIASGSRGLALIGLNLDKVEEPQLLVGGYRSHIDDSVQPYGLVVPAGFDPRRANPYRLDVWLHGRGDSKTEIAFLDERMNKLGQYAPDQTLVLHPFGRHCNAFKFAGETDVYESIAHVATLVEVDPRRQAIRGFSMGGAGCWHLAVHDPGNWFAANPGAGFVDTIVYQGWGSKLPYPMTDARKKLLRWYDVLPWVTNLSNTRTVAYSGEVDKQKRAADRVVAEAAKSGLEIDYVIGAEMGHKIDSASGSTIDATLAKWAAEDDQTPRPLIDLTTYTLRYNRVAWLSITGLQEHWTRGRVRAEINGDQEVQMETSGVTRVKLDFPDGSWPRAGNLKVTIDGQERTVQDWDAGPGFQVELELRGGEWSVVEEIDNELRKRPGMQGPIDDAFCDRFLFVAPSRPASHGAVQRWIDREFKYAQSRWRQLMRGDVRVVQDRDVTKEDIASSHLICFGDFSSNLYLREIASQLPIQWTRDEIRVGDTKYDPTSHAAVLCFPNPRNPEKYVVVNSGMSFREFSNVSNSRQIAMLPDWAVFDVSGDQDGIFAGDVVAEGFFNEQWQLQP